MVLFPDDQVTTAYDAKPSLGEHQLLSLAGEIHEFKEDLRSLDRSKKKEAVKKVIAAMTVGKDVSMLFPDVVNCMQTDDLELKKLVYLYLINYAKTQPDLAIMGVNTFVKARVQAVLPLHSQGQQRCSTLPVKACIVSRRMLFWRASAVL